ncbi:fasciclin domain-containing protein [bacterium]|nr:fasciclin domain-containing protein [bacterium]MDA7680526.1 fasciclin domain-containing protein [bacterium]MDB4745553.1 fasciclin domain-containing protein [Verrucomicrobiota bacterium]
MMKYTIAIIATAASLLLTPTTQAGNTPDKNIVEIAASAGQFNTLVAAVKAAGLVETLVGKGPFTVFAPTDEAFGKLPDGTIADLLKPENKEKLVSILTYHVLSGKVPASAVKTMKVKTVNGQEVSLKVSDKGVTVNSATVIKADIMATNGVIHVIDTVILPH